MVSDSTTPIGFITYGRERRDLEYKGARGRDSFLWSSPEVRTTIAKTAMAMANIGGGAIVIGVDEVAPDHWQANGVPNDVDQSFLQDDVQQYVNQRADPYVQLELSHVDYDRKRFLVIQVRGFNELPVVCTSGDGRAMRPGAIYTRSLAKHETIEIRSQSEMRELLDRAIRAGVLSQTQLLLDALGLSSVAASARLRTIIEALERASAGTSSSQPAARSFEEQRGEL